MKKIYCLLFTIFSVALLKAGGSSSGLAYFWGGKTGGAGVDAVRGVAVDPAGNTYVTGYYAATANFDIQGGNTSFTSAGSRDLFIAKYDIFGQLLWAKSVGGVGVEDARAICVDLNNNIWITGQFTGTVDFDPSANTANLSASQSGDADMFVAKYDASGNYLWAGVFTGGNPDEKGYAICVNPVTGNICVTGTFSGTVDFDPSVAVNNKTCAGVKDAFLLVLNTSGTLVSINVIGGVGDDIGFGIAVDAQGNYCLTGQFGGVVDFDLGNGTNNKTASGPYDAFVVKYNSSYALQFISVIGGTSDLDRGLGISVDASNNIYAGGYFSGTTDIDQTAAVVNVSSYSITVPNGYLVKYSASGAYLWSVICNSTINSAVSAVAAWGSSDVFISGHAGDFDADPDTSQYLIDATANDLFITRYSAAGDIIWGSALATDNIGDGFSITPSFGGGVIVGGNFQNQIDLNQSPNEDIFVTSGLQDGFVAAYRGCDAPASPVAVTDTFCASGSTTLTASGIGFRGWYSSEAGDTYLGAGANFTTPSLNTTTTYWVQDSTCTSGKRTPVTVVVRPNPVVQVNAAQSSYCLGNIAELNASGAASYVWSTQDTGAVVYDSVEVAGLSTYYVVGTNIYGCADTNSVNITAYNVPQPQIQSTDTVICRGESITISDGGNASDTYLWSNGAVTSAITVSPFGTTTYDVTATNGGICSVTASLSITVNFVNTDVTPVANTLTADATGATYQWLNCATGIITGATDSSYTATVDGSYAVIVTSMEGCMDTSLCYSVGGLSVHEVDNGILAIYPNPFHTATEITLNNPSSNAPLQLQVFNVAGQLVKSVVINDQHYVLMADDLCDGVYLLEIIDGEKVYRRKLIKD